MYYSLFELEVLSVEQDLIPYVGQVEPSSIPVEWWIIDPDTHSLINGPSTAVWLPTQNGEIDQTVMVVCGVGIVINERRCPKMFL